MQHQSRAAQIAQADLELELHVDPKTASRIREMHAMKQQAVQREDYDEAKRIKDAIERIRQVGSKIAQLEAYKAVCPCSHHAHALCGKSAIGIDPGPCLVAGCSAS